MSYKRPDGCMDATTRPLWTWPIKKPIQTFLVRGRHLLPRTKFSIASFIGPCVHLTNFCLDIEVKGRVMVFVHCTLVFPPAPFSMAQRHAPFSQRHALFSLRHALFFQRHASFPAPCPFPAPCLRREIHMCIQGLNCFDSELTH